MRRWLYIFSAAVTLGGIVLSSTALAANNNHSEGSRAFPKLQTLSATIVTFSPPEIETPKWYIDQIKAEKAKMLSQQPQRDVQRSNTGRVVTYSISTAGVTSSNLAVFSREVNETLNHSRGWARLGVTFKEIATGGDFNLVLSQAALLPSFSSGCSVEWSCRVGVSVIINDDRWSGASSSWNAAGGSLRDYHHMVVNHEVGHWLGHGHLHCGGAGQVAPVMQQQSIDLEGCVFNPWPLDAEMWSTQLGIG